MIPNQQQERGWAHKRARREDSITVPKGCALLNKLQSSTAPACSGSIGLLVAGTDYNANFFDAGREYFLDDDAQSSFGGPISIDKCLQRKSALGLAGCGNYSFLDFHRSVKL
jgi:hypothetical protein